MQVFSTTPCKRLKYTHTDKKLLSTESSRSTRRERGPIERNYTGRSSGIQTEHGDIQNHNIKIISETNLILEGTSSEISENEPRNYAARRLTRSVLGSATVPRALEWRVKPP